MSEQGFGTGQRMQMKFPSFNFSSAFPFVFAFAVIATIMTPIVWHRLNKNDEIAVCKNESAARREISGVVQRAGGDFYLKSDETYLISSGTRSCQLNDICKALLENIGQPVTATYCNGHIVAFSLGGKSFSF